MIGIYFCKNIWEQTIVNFKKIQENFRKSIFSTNGSKSAFLRLAGQTNPLFNCQVEKNRLQHGRNIYFTRVIVVLDCRRHQTLH